MITKKWREKAIELEFSVEYLLSALLSVPLHHRLTVDRCSDSFLALPTYFLFSFFGATQEIENEMKNCNKIECTANELVFEVMCAKYIHK